MTQMIINADGSQSEVYSKAEHDKNVEEATKAATKTATDSASEAAKTTFEQQLETYKKDNPSGAKEIEDLKSSITEKDAKLAELEGDDDDDKEGDKGKHDEQIKRLRTEREESDKVLTEKLEKMGDTIKEITGDVKTQFIDAAIKGLSEAQIKEAGGEKEARSKIEVKFDSFEGDPGTRSEIAARVADAAILAIGVATVPDVMDNAAGDGGKGAEDHAGGQPKEVSETSKKVGTALGISEEDRKTYGPGGDKYKSSSSVN